MSRPLSPAELDPAWVDSLSTQRYEASRPIEGVRLIELRELVDDGGTFIEVARLDAMGRLEALPEVGVRQVNFSTMMPGAIKAWHLHYNQEDVWYIPAQSRILVGLRDLRAGSPTCGQSMRFVLGAGRSRLLLIPRGVAHGAANPYPEVALMFYFVNQQFSLTEPDERRLPWDAFGADFWEMVRG